MPQGIMAGSWFGGFLGMLRFEVLSGIWWMNDKGIFSEFAFGLLIDTPKGLQLKSSCTV